MSQEVYYTIDHDEQDFLDAALSAIGKPINFVNSAIKETDAYQKSHTIQYQTSTSQQSSHPFITPSIGNSYHSTGIGNNPNAPSFPTSQQPFLPSSIGNSYPGNHIPSQSTRTQSTLFIPQTIQQPNPSYTHSHYQQQSQPLQYPPQYQQQTYPFFPLPPQFFPSPIFLPQAPQQPQPSVNDLFPNIIQQDRDEVEQIKLRKLQEAKFQHLNRLKELQEREEAIEKIRKKEMEDRERMEKEKRMIEFKAAVVIQKWSRRYMVRRRFCDKKVNEIVKYTKPDLYIYEKLLLEIIQQEFIPELLVETCEEIYSPISKTNEFKAYRLTFHVVDECLGELLPEVVKEYLLEFAEQRINLHPPMDPIKLISQEIYDEILKAVIKDTLLETMRQEAEEFLVEKKSQEFFTVVLDEVLRDFDLVNQCIDALNMERIMEDLIEVVVEEEIKFMCARVMYDSGQTKILQKSSDAKSSLTDYILAHMVDKMILDIMMGNISSDGVDFFINDMIERWLDVMILENLCIGYGELKNYKQELSVDSPFVTVPNTAKNRAATAEGYL